MSASVAVESMRTCVPDSIPRCLASCTSTPLIACHVSASIALMALCNADFFGGLNGSIRAKRCVDAESQELQIPIRVAHQMDEPPRAQ